MEFGAKRRQGRDNGKEWVMCFSSSLRVKTSWESNRPFPSKLTCPWRRWRVLEEVSCLNWEKFCRPPTQRCPLTHSKKSWQLRAGLGDVGHFCQLLPSVAVNCPPQAKWIFIGTGQYWATFINSGHYCTVLGKHKK